MTLTSLRLTMVGLLTFTGIFHLAVAAFGGVGDLALPIAAFGILYAVIGFYVRADTKDGSASGSRNAIIAAIVACTIGMAIGGTVYFQNNEPGALLIMLLIDIAIIFTGVMWLRLALKKP